MVAVNFHNRTSPVVQPLDGAQDFRRSVIALIPQLRAFARGLCGQRDEADALCADAVLSAWHRRGTYLSNTNLKTWLFAIMRGRFYDGVRPSFRLQPWGNAVVANDLLPAAPSEPGLALRDIAPALQVLSHEQREALLLVAAAGFSYDRAAIIASCAVGTIKSRVSRARRILEVSMTVAQPAQYPLDTMDAEPFDEDFSGADSRSPAAPTLRAKH